LVAPANGLIEYVAVALVHTDDGPVIVPGMAVFPLTVLDLSVPCPQAFLAATYNVPVAPKEEGQVITTKVSVVI
jgi:hypothetical protein